MNAARLRALLPLPLILAAGACEVLPPPAPPVVSAPPALRAPDWATAPAPAIEARTVDVRLKPILDGREVGHVEVALRFSEPPGEFGEPLPLRLWMPQLDDGESTPPDAVDEVSARDAEGALPLRPKGATAGRAEWRSDRRPSGAVSVAYRVRIPRAEGPAQGGARAVAGGFTATGAGLFMLPDEDGTWAVKLAWDLSAAGEGPRGLSSIETGANTTMDRLRGAMVIAGPIGRASIEAGGGLFEAAWLGTTRVDPLEVIPFAARAWDHQRAFFRDVLPTPYNVFLRAAPGQKPGVVAAARAQGTMVLVGDEPGFGGGAKLAVAREVARHWMGSDRGLRFEGDPAARPLEAGLAAHFGREIALGAELVTPAEVDADLRALAERAALQGSPDDRATLYVADADAAIRAKSGGKRALGDVVLGLVDRARGSALPIAEWKKALRAELGAEADARFDLALTKREPFAPRDDAFGPCWKPVKKKIPRGDAKKTMADATLWARDAKAPPAACARLKQVR